MRTAITLPSKELAFLQKVLEASEGLAVLKTIDGKAGKACLIYPESNQEQVSALINNFSSEHNLTIDE